MKAKADVHDDLFRAIESTLVQHTAFVDAYNRASQVFRRAQVSSEPICLPIHGESRTGKSTVLDELCRAYPRQRHEAGLEVPILQVKTPSEPTVMGLVELMLSKLGDPRYYTGTKCRKTNRLIKLMKAAGTQVVCIDEFQHFVDKSSLKVLHHVADWLKILVDESQVGLIVAGLPRCQIVIEQNEQLRGRFLAPAVMPRFDWSDETSRCQFVGILASFHESMSRYFDLPRFDTEDMAFRIYVGCGGLIGYVAKFLNQAVWNAGEAGRTAITLAELHAAHTESVLVVEGESRCPRPFTNEFDADPKKEQNLALARSIGIESNEKRMVPDKGSVPSASSMNDVLRT